MEIMQIWMSQRNLRRAAQIPAMVQTLKEGGLLPRIVLCRTEDGLVQVEDGHHRLAAIWLSGRTELERHQYLLLEKDRWRPRCGKITNLLGGYPNGHGRWLRGEHLSGG